MESANIESATMSPFKSYIGKKSCDQSKLNQRFISLHAEAPVQNDIQAAIEPDAVAIFDGQFWREFNLEALSKANIDALK
ncbi:MAG: hypothetical protein GY697_24070 [Desulfobacterales bacterium]|nr:hypothetical protein [Desulfobacterales bacterium]